MYFNNIMVHLFTIGKMKQPHGIIDEYNKIGTFEFIYENNENYYDFITNNPIENYSIELFRKINNEIVKRHVFILYYLYVKGGVYIDLRVIPTMNVNTIKFEHFGLFCVRSIMNEKNLFLGILGSQNNRKVVLDLIHELSMFDYTNKNHYEIIYEKILNSKKVLVLGEKKIINNCVSTVDKENNILFNHYVNDELFYKYPIIQKNINSLTEKDIKIGITLTIFDTPNKFFSNGINQNSLYLCEVLLNGGFDVYFIIQDSNLTNISEDKIKEQLYDNRFKYIQYSNILSLELNVLITLSFSGMDNYVHNYLKYTNTKTVGYFCGNSYIIDTETILYDQHKTKENEFQFLLNNKCRYDEIWSIPQMSDINLHYWKILYRTNAIKVPFVWSKNAIKLHALLNNCSEEELLYKNKHDEKKIAILEPNISIMKWALPAALICEDCYRNNKNIKHLYITNINSSSNIIDFNMNKFNKMMKNLDLVKDHKCSIEARFNTLEIMSKIADIVVSHQWGNPLNYIYFDLAWLGYPIVHNARLCKDVGYYYDDFNYTDGSEILNEVIQTHDENIEAYIVKNRKNIEKYLSDNIILIAKYKALIFDVIHKS